MIATSGSRNGDSSERADLYRAERNFFLQLDLSHDTYCYMMYRHTAGVSSCSVQNVIKIRLQISVVVPQTPINVASST
jgi:hypothetical protein